MASSKSWIAPAPFRATWPKSPRSMRSINSGPLPLRSTWAPQQKITARPAAAAVDDPLGQDGQGLVRRTAAAAPSGKISTSGRRRAPARPAAAAAAGCDRTGQRHQSSPAASSSRLVPQVRHQRPAVAEVGDHQVGPDADQPVAFPGVGLAAAAGLVAGHRHGQRRRPP